jgi:hypothetical protein
MDGWDIAVLLVGGFVAAVALVRLMVYRRNQLAARLLAESQNAEKRKASEKAPLKEGNDQ